MSDDDKSSLEKLASMATTVVESVETEIKTILNEMDEELSQGPVHIGNSPNDSFGLTPDESTPPLSIPEGTKEEDEADASKSRRPPK